MMNFLKKIFSSLNNKSDMNKYLILGIGNIGNEYDDTRHNIGFEIVDQLSQNLDTKFESVKLAQRAEGSFKGKKIIIIKPNNYVNNSGRSLLYWQKKEKVSLEHFPTPLFKKIAGYVLDDKSQLDYSSIIEKFEGDERDLITKILFMETTDIPPEEIVSDCLKILISAPIKKKISSIRVSIREKESNGDFPIAEISEIEKYRKQLNDLKI